MKAQKPANPTAIWRALKVRVEAGTVMRRPAGRAGRRSYAWFYRRPPRAVAPGCGAHHAWVAGALIQVSADVIALQCCIAWCRWNRQAERRIVPAGRRSETKHIRMRAL